jgi:hypothetical protein
MQRVLAQFMIAAFVILPLAFGGCARRMACDVQTAVNFDNDGQKDTEVGDYTKSVTDFDQAAQALAACADETSDGEHFRRLYGEAQSLGGEARSLFQLGEARAEDVVNRQTSIFREISDDPNADVTFADSGSTRPTIRYLARLRIEGSTDSSVPGRPMPTPYFATVAAAENHCPADKVVYVEWPSEFYYAPENQRLGREGAFVCKADAVANNYTPGFGAENL